VTPAWLHHCLRSCAGFLSRPDAALLGRWLLGPCMPCGSTCRVLQPAAAARGPRSRAAGRVFWHLGMASPPVMPRRRVFVAQVEWARCGPSAGVACSSLLTRPAGCRPAPVLGCRRMLRQQRADQAAELRGDVQAHAAEGPRSQHALPVHHAAVGVAAHCGAGARTRAHLPLAVQEQGPGLASRTCADRQLARHPWPAAAACCDQSAHASLRPVPQIICCWDRAPRCLCARQC